jgi:hypothetical protein
VPEPLAPQYPDAVPFGKYTPRYRLIAAAFASLAANVSSHGTLNAIPVPLRT